MPDIYKYLQRITSEHSDKPKYVKFVTSLLDPMIDAQKVFQNLLTTFDVDTALGVQLDAIGQWVGRARQIAMPIAGVYFSMDSDGLGFGQGYWKGPYDSDTGITVLDDQTYRQLLKAKIIMNSWDGSIPVAASAISELFANDPNVIIAIQDNQDMTMTVAVAGQVPGNILLALLVGNYVPINPEGVAVNYLITSVDMNTLFGFDTEGETVGGFDHGAWSGQLGEGPGVCGHLGIVSLTATSVTFSWLPPTTGVGPFWYQLQYHLGAEGAAWVLTPKPSTFMTDSLNNLAPNTTYSVEVFAVNSSGPGPATDPLIFTTKPGPPGQVTALRATGYTANTVNLLWNIVVGDQVLYQVEYRALSDSLGPFVEFNGTLRQTSTVVNGLEYATVYEFRVYALNEFGAGPYSEILYAGTAGATPGPPMNLAVNAIGWSDVQLTWDVPETINGPFTYVAQYALDVNPIQYQSFIGSYTLTETGGSCDILGLQLQQTYLFRVYAVNQAGSGLPCDPVMATTGEGVPSSPTSILAYNPQQTSIDLAWSPVKTAVTYQVQTQLVAAPTSWTDTGDPVSATQTTVASLISGLFYNLRVVAINDAELKGSPSHLVSMVTSGVPPGQVTGLEIADETNSSATLSWNEPDQGNAPIVYQAQWKLASATIWNDADVPTPNRMTVVQNLQNGQSYDFQVFAINDFGVGPASATVNSATTAGALTISWDPSRSTDNITFINNNKTALTTTSSVGSVRQTAFNSTSITLAWGLPDTGGFYGVLGNLGHATGKYFVEFSITYPTPDFAVGLASQSWNMNAVGLGSDRTGVGFYQASQSATINQTIVLQSIGGKADVLGDTISLAVDLDNKLFWFTSNAMRAQLGNVPAWNNSTTAVPGVSGGISLAGLTLDTYYPAFSDLEASAGCTLNGGASAFVVTTPTGFTGWGGITTLLTPPGQVTGLTNGTASPRSIPLTWAVPVTGSPVVYYQVLYRKVGGGVWINGARVSQTSAVVQYLIPTTSYEFKVYAVNAAGAGADSILLTVSTITPLSAEVTYRGLNLEGSDLGKIDSLSATFPHANAVVIPAFLSTSSQNSTDVFLNSTLEAVAGWIDSAVRAGYEVFIGVYLLPRDNSPPQTLQPGPSVSAVASFMHNLVGVCAAVAQVGQAHGALGMWVGVELQPWAGVTVGDFGPWGVVHQAEWQAVYNACKAVWPTGTIGYAALQTTLCFGQESGSWSVIWDIWDALVVDLYPGATANCVTAADFQNYFDTQPDPDPATVTSLGWKPLFIALTDYSTTTGRALIVNQCGIVPAPGNQLAPGKLNVVPPPFDYQLQASWFRAVLQEVLNRASNFCGFFAWDGGTSGYLSAYSGTDWWGIADTASAATVDTFYAYLTGIPNTLTAPTGLHVVSSSDTVITVAWNALSGADISYVIEWAVHGTNNWNFAQVFIPTATLSFLAPATFYDIRVFAVEGTLDGPVSPSIQAFTGSTGSKQITINNPGVVLPNTSFTLSGTLSGFQTPPNLLYIDDPSLGAVPGISSTVSNTSVILNWGIVNPPTEFDPSETVTTSTFSFTHPGLAAGTHNITVTDDTVGGSITLTIGTPTQPSIIINALGAVNVNNTFTVSGSLVNCSSVPTLSYVDDSTGGSHVIAGNTAYAFSFTHPAWLTTGFHTLQINATGGGSPSGFNASTSYTVQAVQTPLAITINPLVTLANYPFTVTGTLTGFTSAPSLVYLDDYSSTTNSIAASAVTVSSFSFTHPGITTTGAHRLTVQVTTNPAVNAVSNFSVSVVPSLNLDTTRMQGIVAAGTTFNVYGTYSGFNTTPTLAYHDDQGSAILIPSSQVSGGNFWFTHPAIATGAHALSIQAVGIILANGIIWDYTCVTAYPPGQVKNVSLYFLYNPLGLTAFFSPPDTLQTYTYTCAIGTTPSFGTPGVISGGEWATWANLQSRQIYYFEIVAYNQFGTPGTPWASSIQMP